MVTLNFPKRKVGDQLVTLNLEDARMELQAAMEDGCLVAERVETDEQDVLYRVIRDLEEVQEDSEIRVEPNASGG